MDIFYPHSLLYSCLLYTSCGGCQYLDMPYEKQLEHKKKEVSDLLRPFCRVEEIIGMDDPFHYRNKVHAVMARDRKGRIISGVYKEGTHTVLPAVSYTHLDVYKRQVEFDE